VFPECDDAIPLIKIQQETERDREKKKERNEKNTMI